MLIKTKYYLIIFIILFLQKVSPISASEINSLETDITTTSSRAVTQDNQPIYSMRYLKSDLIYGSCIAVGCMAGTFIALAPTLMEYFRVTGVDTLMVLYIRPISIGMLVGGSIGCCAGAVLKGNAIRGIPLCTNTPTGVQSPESNV